MTLEEYLQENYKDVLTEYQQFLRKDELPQVGTKVEILVSGYGNGSIGSVRTIIGHGYKGQETIEGGIWGGNYLELSGGYLCDMNNWWKELKVLSE